MFSLLASGFLVHEASILLPSPFSEGGVLLFHELMYEPWNEHPLQTNKCALLNNSTGSFQPHDVGEVRMVEDQP